MNDGWFSWQKVRFIAKAIRNHEIQRAGDWLRVRDAIEKVNQDKRLCLFRACTDTIGPERTAELFRGITLPKPEEVEA